MKNSKKANVKIRNLLFCFRLKGFLIMDYPRLKICRNYSPYSSAGVQPNERLYLFSWLEQSPCTESSLKCYTI